MGTAARVLKAVVIQAFFLTWSIVLLLSIGTSAEYNNRDRSMIGFGLRKLRIVLDYALLTGEKIPPVTPNILDVRIVRQEVTADFPSPDPRASN